MQKQIQAQLLLVKKDQANIKDVHDEIVQYTNTKPTGAPTITRTTKTKNSAPKKLNRGKGRLNDPILKVFVTFIHLCSHYHFLI